MDKNIKIIITIIVILLILFLLYTYISFNNIDNFNNSLLVYQRGQPKMMKMSCPSGYYKKGALCYQKCKIPHFYSRKYNNKHYCMGECSELYGNNYMNNGYQCRKYVPTKSCLPRILPRPYYHQNRQFVNMKCPTNYNLNSISEYKRGGGMCYPKCKPNFIGDKVMCWEKTNKKVDKPYPSRKYWL
jgi:hypothetical protein